MNDRRTWPAITVRQPWATLCVLGAKRYEVRAEPTDYRGPLAIHASVHYRPRGELVATRPPAAEILQAAGYKPWLDARPYWDALPLGAVVGLVDVMGVELVPRDVLRPEDAPSLQLDAREVRLGSFIAGRWAWRISNARRLANPIPCRGGAGLWEWRPPVLPLRFLETPGAAIG